MTKAPYMKLWHGDYLADTSHLSTIEHGAYLLLLMVMWRNGGTLPNDDVRLARYAKLRANQWTKMRSTILEFFEIDGDTIRHQRITKELESCARLSQSQSHNAKAKSLKNKETGSAIAKPEFASHSHSLKEAKLSNASEESSSEDTAREDDKPKVAEPKENPPPDEKPKVPEEAIDRLCNLSGYFPTRSWVEHRLAEEIASVGEPRVMAALDDLEVAKGTGRLRCDAVKALRGFVAKARPKGGAQASSPIVTDPDRIAQIAEKARAKRLAERGVTMGAIADAG
jgi:uncharacterized protein YdaU (DUF1376 family)